MRRILAAVTVIGSAAVLAACSMFPHAETRPPTPELKRLGAQLAQIDGVQDAVAASSFDGSPTKRRLNVRLYLEEPAPTDLAPVVAAALKSAWAFDGFRPAGYSLQVWNGPIQRPPYDNSRRVDLATVFDALDLPTSRVYKKDLYPTKADLAAKFGPKN